MLDSEPTVVGMSTTLSVRLPDNIAGFIKAHGNASEYVARVMRQQMIREQAPIVARCPPRDEGWDADAERVAIDVE